MTEVEECACEILEKANTPITAEDAQRALDNARAIYNDLYSDFIQRKRALRTIEVYSTIKSMLCGVR